MVVLCPAEPDVMWKSLILRYKKRLTYLKGDMMRTEDLYRAQVQDSVGCFIMADRFCEDTNAQDATTILRALSVYSFNRRIKCFVQLIEPENRRHLMAVGISPSRVICHNEIKMGLIAQGCLWPGFATMLANLLLVTGPNEFSPTDKWQRSYCHGAQQEVYRGPVGMRFAGRSFSSVVAHVYQETGALLIAVSDVSAGVMLHPGAQYLFKKDDFGFFMAANYEVMRELLDSNGTHKASVWCSFMECVSGGATKRAKLEAKRKQARERFEYGASIEGPSVASGANQGGVSGGGGSDGGGDGGGDVSGSGKANVPTNLLLPPIEGGSSAPPSSSINSSALNSSALNTEPTAGGGVLSRMKRTMSGLDPSGLLAGRTRSRRASRVHVEGEMQQEDKTMWGSHLGGSSAKEVKRAIRSRHGSISTSAMLDGAVLSQHGLKNHGKMRR
jgi:hypothetical protein